MANIPVEQFGDMAMYKLVDLPAEASHVLALTYQLALVEAETRGTLWNPVPSPIARQIVAGCQSLYDCGPKGRPVEGGVHRIPNKEPQRGRVCRLQV